VDQGIKKLDGDSMTNFLDIKELEYQQNTMVKVEMLLFGKRYLINYV